MCLISILQLITTKLTVLSALLKYLSKKIQFLFNLFLHRTHWIAAIDKGEGSIFLNFGLLKRSKVGKEKMTSYNGLEDSKPNCATDLANFYPGGFYWLNWPHWQSLKVAVMFHLFSFHIFAYMRKPKHQKIIKPHLQEVSNKDEHSVSSWHCVNWKMLKFAAPPLSRDWTR